MKKIISFSRFFLVLGLIIPCWEALASTSICSPGEKTQVLARGTWYPATAVRADGEKCLVRYEGYKNQEEWVTAQHMHVSASYVPASKKSIPPTVGSFIQALGQKWQPGHIKEIKGELFLVHYEGYDPFWDEWLDLKHLKLKPGKAPAVGDSVQGLWERWLPAHVKEVKGDQLLVHYEGTATTADEWVGPNRYRW